MTIEEVLVKFTGDASSLANASDKAKAKTQGLREDVDRLARVFERAKANSSSYEIHLKALTSAANKYSESLEKIARQEAKRSGTGGRLSGGLASGASFGAGAGIVGTLTSAFLQVFGEPIKDLSINAFSQIESALSGRTSLRESQRIQEREDEQSSYLESLRGRRIGDRERQTQREMSQQLDPITGKGLYGARLDIQLNAQKDFEKQMRESKGNIARLEKEMNENDTVWSRVKEQQFSEAKKNRDAELKHYRDLEKAAHAAGEAIKDMEAGGGPIQQKLKEADRAILNAQRRAAGAGLNRKQLDDLKIDQEVEDTLRDKGDAATLLQEEKELRDKLTQKYKAERETDEWIEKTALKNAIKKAKASAGFSGVEADVLGRRAMGEENGNVERIELNDIQRADALKQGLMTPMERGQKQLDDLENIRYRLDPETYYRAVARIQKGMQGPGPAASRAATGFGSAEHTARILQYQRVLDEPQAMANNIERVNREKPPEGKGQSEANTYLRQIRDKITKTPAVELRPANLGG